VTEIRPDMGMGTLVNHIDEGHHSEHAHVMPIYQTSTFGFPDTRAAADVFAGERPGYAYTRGGNPNFTHLNRQLAYLEGLDLIAASPDVDPSELVVAQCTASGMAATAASVFGHIGAGGRAIVQRGLYGNSFKFWYVMAPRMGIEVHWVSRVDPASWEQAFADFPDPDLVFVETPSNPTLDVVDLSHLSGLAHEHGAWVFVDNTFATPFHQRPLTLGCDVVIHSTTKYISGHGQVIGGAIVSSRIDYMAPRGSGVGLTTRMFGVTPSPNDTWLISNGLKTFEIRMQRHAENAMALARWLEADDRVARVHYPGLRSDPHHEVAARQMSRGFGGMVSFEVAGGFEAGMRFTNAVDIPTLAVSLGNVDSLIQHPASMTHAAVPPEERAKAGISDGLIRLSVGIEDIDDLISDLDRALDA